ncbi:hypothetical protein QU24_16175 [Pantoea rodasii]|uniref:Uncharacterized protein n=2 Tax=Pantoea TaxID=53335 RepID=A0A0U3USF8_9GAMM|nr:hypothetical protein LK04_14400 [Pantoea vagans]KHJ67034.1 hypothetical protein QU24_16175 [Pantoea rodasii]
MQIALLVTHGNRLAVQSIVVFLSDNRCNVLINFMWSSKKVDEVKKPFLIKKVQLALIKGLYNVELAPFSPMLRLCVT